MSRSVWLECALNGPWGRDLQPAIPVTADEIVEAGIAAHGEGAAILLISADFDEVLKISDRIVVLFEGEVMGTYSGKDAPVKEISLAMAGK